jgi:hypothetical protein
MRAQNLEDLVPGLREALESERLNRSLVFCDVFTWTVCGCELVHLTPRHRLELRLAGNAFTRYARPLAGDLFAFLWRLNPAFTRKPLLHPMCWLAFVKVWWRVVVADLDRAEREVHRYLAAMLQDVPEENLATEHRSSEAAKAICGESGDAYFYLTALKSLPALDGKSYMDTPCLVLDQLWRAWKFDTDDNPQFSNRSDELATAWHRANLIARHKEAF